MEKYALLVSLLALFFTILSFWWMNWRKGKLNCGPVNALYSGTATENSADIGQQKIQVLGVPLILWNSGARPLVVSQLRAKQSDFELVWEYERTQSTFDTNASSCEADYFTLPLSLSANEIKSINAVFNLRVDGFEFMPRKYKFKIQAMVFGKNGWIDITTTELDCSKFSGIQIFELNESCKPYEVGK
ncbi:hypothetical protein ACVQAZ_004253 [Vibrio vulnificus]